MRRVFAKPLVCLVLVCLGSVYAPARAADSYNELFGLGSHSEDANLEGWYKLQETTATSTATDSSSNARHGTYNSIDPSTDTRTGPTSYYSSAIDFNGGNVSTLDPTYWDGVSGLTACMWVECDLTDHNDDALLSDWSVGGVAGHILFRADNADFELFMKDSSINTIGPAFSTGDDLPQSTWVFSVARYDGSNVEIFADAVSVATSAHTVTIGTASELLTIGASPHDAARHFDGGIAGVSTWSDALTAAEIAQVFNGPEPTYTSGASLSSAGAYNVGTWDSQSNGTLLYTVQVVNPSGTVLATVAESGTTSGTVNLGDYSGIAYLLVKAVNNGGADTGDFATRTSGYGSSGDSYYELTSVTVEAASYNQLFGRGSYDPDFHLEVDAPLNDNAASTTVVNNAGTNGTLGGGDNTSAKTTSVSGPFFTSAMTLNGTDDYISFPVTISGDCEMGVWDYSGGNSENYVSVGRADTDGDNISYVNTTSGGDIRANTLAGSTNSSTGASNPTGSTWEMKGGRFLFQDDRQPHREGVLVGSANATNTSEAAYDLFGVGVRIDATPGGFTAGPFAHAWLFSRALTAAERLQVNAGPEPYYNGGGIAAPSGITQVGETLTAATDAGNWVDPSNGSVVYAYQWYRANDGAGTGAAAISGATSSTYVLQFADDTKYIACQITASNTGGSDPTYGVVMSSYSAQVADTAPALVSKTIDAAGTSLTLVFDQTMQFESSPNSTGLTLHVDAGTPTLTYASGTGSTTLVYTIGTTVNSGQTCTLDYNSTTGDIEDVSGTDLATFSGSAVTNNSVQSGGGPTATNVIVTGIMREGETLTGSYTYNANGNGAEGTSTYRWLASDVAISGATSTTYVLTSAENADDIKFEVTPVSNDPVSGSATPSIAYGPVGAALANTPVLVVWPDTAVGEGDSDPPDRLALGSGVTTGRTVANVIRARFRTATANDPETTTDFTNAAAARFTDDGYNVLVVNNDLAPTKDIILYPYATAVTTGFAGWADTEIVDYFEDNIDALFNAGYRVDCLLLDFENGIFGTDYGNIPNGSGGEGETVIAHMRGTVLPGLSGDYSSLPSGPNYATYLSASTSSQDFYDQRTLFNQAVMDAVREQIYDNCLVHYFERYPSGVVATYNRNDWASPQPNRTIATLYEPDSTVYGASSPELYYGLDHSREQIANLASKATSYPWVNPSTFTAADDAAYPVLVDYCDAQGMPLIATWASRKTLGERATEAPEIGTAAAKYDAQISVADTSGNSLTPTKNGFDETTDYREGPGGYFPSAWDIYGSNNLTIADSLLGTEGTCSMWVCTDDLATSRLALGSDATNRHWIGVDASGNLYARLGTAAAFGTTAATAGTWYHVCLCWNSGGGEFFINNSSAGTVSTTVNAITAGSGRIAAFSGGANWNGGIAGVRFYSSDLAADSTTRTSLYNEGKALFFTDPDTVGLPTPGNLLFAPHVPSDFNYSIQWYKDASPVSGATSHFIDWASHGFGSYFPRVTVTNGLGSTVTDGPTVNTYLIPREQLQGRLTNLKSGL